MTSLGGSVQSGINQEAYMGVNFKGINPNKKHPKNTSLSKKVIDSRVNEDGTSVVFTSGHKNMDSSMSQSNVMFENSPFLTASAYATTAGKIGERFPGDVETKSYTTLPFKKTPTKVHTKPHFAEKTLNF